MAEHMCDTRHTIRPPAKHSLHFTHLVRNKLALKNESLSVRRQSAVRRKPNTSPFIHFFSSADFSSNPSFLIVYSRAAIAQLSS